MAGTGEAAASSVVARNADVAGGDSHAVRGVHGASHAARGVHGCAEGMVGGVGGGAAATADTRFLGDIRTTHYEAEPNK